MSINRHQPASVSVVIPCLDEAKTVASCVRQAFAALDSMELPGEVVVCDNGSTDGSAEVAAAAGARIVNCPTRGYGNAVRCGVAHTHGELIVMGDADGSHDFSEIDALICAIRNGADIVIGNRFQRTMVPDAMPWKNRYIGNPVLTGLLNLLFRAGIGDAHCGLRAFSRTAFFQMKLESPGMELASEMVLKAAKSRLSIAEVPVTVLPPGRDGRPHLRPWRDGWRHLKLLLMFSPLHLFLIPGSVLALIGLILVLLPARGVFRFAGLYLDIHWMVLGVLLLLLGMQICQFGIIARLFAVLYRFPESDVMLARFRRIFALERGLLVGACGCVIGFGIDAWIMVEWLRHTGPLQEVRAALCATALMAVGVQTIFFSFLIAILDREPASPVNVQTKVVSGVRAAAIPVESRNAAMPEATPIRNPMAMAARHVTND